ncbi:MAG: ABC transporter permease [Proteobacteria bacterium]|nr:ABC transporter permease [Pseudomonadota bacterium]
MTTIIPTADIVRTVDGVPLKVKLRRAERMRKIRAVSLIAPLFLFLAVTFVMPIGIMLFRSVQNPEISQILPRTAQAIQQWDGEGLPGEDVVAAFIADLRAAKEAKTHGKVAKRLNYDLSGFRSLILQTARRPPPPETPPSELLDKLIEIDKRWGETRYWATIKKAAPPYTMFYLLAALDRNFDVKGNVIHAPPEVSIYIDVLERTFWMSFIVTAVCFLLGYPIAYLLATLPTKHSNLLMILVLLPFWTSLLVRTTAWVVLLQTQGVVNDAAVALGLWSERIQLIHNRTGVYVAMVHILLPFMVLPLYSVMKTISPAATRAARSLGANPFTAFVRIYLPQTVPGIGAGSLLVFILSIGYYITPALVGGSSGQMISNFIAYHMKSSLNWGLAGALGAILLVLILVLYWLYNRLIGIEKMRMG